MDRRVSFTQRASSKEYQRLVCGR